MVKNSEKIIDCVFNYLPRGLAAEIARIADARRCGRGGIREIRIRAEGRSSLLVLSESIPLFYTVTRDEVAETVSRISDGALYARRDSIATGYVSLPYG